MHGPLNIKACTVLLSSNMTDMWC